MLTMVSQTLHSHALPDDFANQIGRLIEARGQVIEASFDPNALPDLLAELVLSDEANGRPVTVRVVQRPGGGTVRGGTIAPVEGVPRGASLLNTLSPSTVTPSSVR
jgi:F0F1-type ATP synthase beta subunit